MNSAIFPVVIQYVHALRLTEQTGIHFSVAQSYEEIQVGFLEISLEVDKKLILVWGFSTNQSVQGNHPINGTNQEASD